MTATTFFNSLPVEVLEVVDQLNDLGFRVGFVGGICRDFILEQKIGTDFDCELRPLRDLNLKKQWKNLYYELCKRHEVEKLSYDVIKLKINKNVIELTYPRIEQFNSKSGHSNFEAIHIADLEYNKGFLRRDFTVNAIMFEKLKDNISLIDPFNGIDHLNKKLLVPCSDTFPKDPVRFLRAIRFGIKLGFKYSYSLSSYLNTMSIDGLSNFYIKSELTKSQNPIVMFGVLFSYQKGIFPKEDLLIKYSKFCKKYKNFFGKDFNSLLNIISLSFKLDKNTRKELIQFFGFSVKKFTYLSEYNFKDFDFTNDYEVDELIDNKNFLDFCEFIFEFRKIDFKNDELLRLILKEYKIINFSTEKVKKLINDDSKFSKEDQGKYPKKSIRYVLLAKSYINL